MSSLNPVTKIVIAAIIGCAVLLTLDPITSGLILVAELLLLPFAGLSARQLTFVLVPLFFATVLAVISNLLYGSREGQTLWVTGSWVITSTALSHALAVGLRIPAIALPSVVLFMTTNSTDLAEALAQIWRLPVRFVMSALSAMRLVGQMSDDWQMMSYARRIRGVARPRNPLARLSNFTSQALLLLAGSIRRGSLLATAMQARAFESAANRTWARESQLHVKDHLAVAGTLVACAIVYAISISWGAWQLVFTA